MTLIEGAGTSSETLAASSIFEHPPAADHGGDRRLAAHDVFADGCVDVDGHEGHHDRHAQAVQAVQLHRPADGRNDPAEQGVAPVAMAGALAVQAEAREQHAEGQQREEKNIMSWAMGLWPTYFADISPGRGTSAVRRRPPHHWALVIGRRKICLA